MAELMLPSEHRARSLTTLKTQMELQEAQARAEEAAAARQRAAQARQLFSEYGDDLVRGDQSAIERLGQFDPETALDLQGKVRTNRKAETDADKASFDFDEAQREAAQEKLDRVGMALTAVSAASPEVRGIMYQRQRRALAAEGFDLSQVPPEYDENWLRTKSAELQTMSERLAATKEEREAAKPPEGPKGSLITLKMPDGKIVPVRSDDPRVDELTAQGAIPVTTPSSNSRRFRITTGPDGQTTIEESTGGSDEGAGALTRPTQNTVQGNILKGGETLASLRAIKARAKPEFQTIGTRWNNFKTAVRDKAGFEVDEKDAASLQEFTEYRAEVSQLFSTILNQLSGQAVTPQEFKRSEAWLPNTGTGFFDGDSPIELASKVRRAEDFIMRALAKHQYINRNGLKLTDVDVDDMPKIMRERGDALAKEYEKKGLKGDDLNQAVRGTLMEEFGIGVQ